MPTLKDNNPTWQAINKELNADVNMNVIPGADYRAKFATTMSSGGNDLPDIMHLFFGYTVAPNIPGFLKAQCADLTPYLAGDAAKDYPNLAAIPTPAWKNSLAAIDGALYLVPIHRQMTSIPPYGGNFFKNVDMWDTELGQDFVPKNADDFKKALTTLTHPQENRWGIGSFGTGATLFGLGSFSEMFGTPNNWKLDASGKLIKDRETEEFKAAVGFMRDLFAAGVYWPDSIQSTNARADFVGKKFAVSPEGQGNSWVDFWQRGATQQTPPTRFGMIKPFVAQDSQKPIHFLGSGFVSTNALKKASPERIKELLRIMNWLAAPFGSQEDLMLTYGLAGTDYNLDAKGNPKPTQDGTGRAGYVPWRYVAQHPWVYYQADLPGFAKASHEAEQATLPARRRRSHQRLLLEHRLRQRRRRRHGLARRHPRDHPRPHPPHRVRQPHQSLANRRRRCSSQGIHRRNGRSQVKHVAFGSEPTAGPRRQSPLRRATRSFPRRPRQGPGGRVLRCCEASRVPPGSGHSPVADPPAHPPPPPIVRGHNGALEYLPDVLSGVAAGGARGAGSDPAEPRPRRASGTSYGPPVYAAA